MKTDRSGPFAVLSVAGQLFDPDTIRPYFSLPAKGIRKKGDQRRSSRSSRIITASQGYCRFSTEGVVFSSSIDAHVSFLLREVATHAEAFAQTLRRQDAHCEITCFPIYEGDGERFGAVSPEALALAERLGVPVGNLNLGVITLVDDRP